MAPKTSPISIVDHVSITVGDLDATCDYYDRLFGIEVSIDYKPAGKSLVRQVKIGGTMLSLHQMGNGIERVARHPTVGAADLCFRWEAPVEDAVALLERHGVEIVEGPVPRTYSDGRLSLSFYFCDPDGNLIELMAPRAAA
jgi:catechol 2,3-dioxygenase-like lactoylglutathione lyase family enzyme